MPSDESLEAAIVQLLELGVTRNQALKALQRYNYDVARAADYIFSGLAEEDEEDENDRTAAILSDEALARQINAEEEQNSTPRWDPPSGLSSSETLSNTSTHNSGSSWKEKDGPDDMDPLEKEQTEPVHWNKQDNDQAWRDPAMWSVVPFTPKETITPPPGNWRENERITVTAWRDPDDPTQRMKLSSIPTGLRPPFWDFAFAPVFLQSLLHVSFFRYLLMSYRPVPDAWGSPLSYWRGAGEAIPIRTFHPTEDPSQGAFTLEPRISSTDHPNSSFPYASHNPFHPSNGPSEPETSKYAMKALSKSERVMAELQKLSAFMLLTKRRYANVSHLTQALNDQVMSSSWGQYSDRSVEEFLDALFQCLEECYANGKPAVETRFRDLLRLRAQVRYPYEPDLEEVNYLSLGYNEYMTTFYDCLDPLVYENHEKPNKDADTCSVNSDSSSEPEIPHRYRLTTFHEIPPLLFVTLENRSLNDSLSSSDRPLYTVDKTIYMDRYLHKNRDIALSIHQQIESYKKEIGDIKKEMEMLRSTEIKDELKYDKRKLLSDTLGYFESLPTSDESDPTLTERVQLVRDMLHNARNYIDQRLEDLQKTYNERSSVLKTLFNVPELQKTPYDLRAILYHDNISSAGHYWAYIWVEPSEQNLLCDIETDAGWYRFADAIVTPVTEGVVFNDTTTPFALLYVDRHITTVSQTDLINAIPQSLQSFIASDNEDFMRQVDFANDQQTLDRQMHDMTLEVDDNMNDRQRYSIERSMSPIEETWDDDDRSVAVNNPFSKIRNTTIVLMHRVQQLDDSDYRFMRSIIFFLAKSGNQETLERILLLYGLDDSSANVECTGDSASDAETKEKPMINEAKARGDPDFALVWNQFETYVSIGLTVAKALRSFAENNDHIAIDLFVEAKQQEAQWKSQMVLDPSISDLYRGWQHLSFETVIERFGRVCLMNLNKAAYTKAMNEAYRTRGLEEAMRVAQKAQVIIGPEKISGDSLFGELGERWLSFTGMSDMNLSDSQAELLNALVMGYLEGQNTGNYETSGDQTPCASPLDDVSDEPVWFLYKQTLVEATLRLSR